MPTQDCYIWPNGQVSLEWSRTTAGDTINPEIDQAETSLTLDAKLGEGASGIPLIKKYQTGAGASSQTWTDLTANCTCGIEFWVEVQRADGPKIAKVKGEWIDPTMNVKKKDTGCTCP